MNGRKLIFKAYSGSHLYGLNTPKSDLDFKGVIIPSKNEIKKKTYPKMCYTNNSKASDKVKNQSGDVDETLFTLMGFLKLCAEGQTAAVEMLFTPRDLYIHSSPEWEFLVANRNLLIHRNIGSFFSLARSQAYKYSVKGERIEANKVILTWANQFNPNSRIKDQMGSLEELIKNNVNLVDTDKKPLICLVIRPGPQGEDVLHLQVSNKKSPLTVTFKHFKKGIEKTLSEYGHRALLANENKGADFKALSHAVRVGYEAIELLTTHQLVFPIKEKERVLAIKKGAVPFPEIEEQIESLLKEITLLEESTTLPKGIDLTFWNKWVKTQYDLMVYPAWWVKIKSWF